MSNILNKIFIIFACATCSLFSVNQIELKQFISSELDLLDYMETEIFPEEIDKECLEEFYLIRGMKLELRRILQNFPELSEYIGEMSQSNSD